MGHILWGAKYSNLIEPHGQPLDAAKSGIRVKGVWTGALALPVRIKVPQSAQPGTDTCGIDLAKVSLATRDQRGQNPKFPALKPFRLLGRLMKVNGGNLRKFMRKTVRVGETIFYCMDQGHAEETRKALNNLYFDVARRYSDYVAFQLSLKSRAGVLSR
jgi:hypothetical protein